MDAFTQGKIARGIDRLVTTIQTDTSLFQGSKIIPATNSNYDVVEWDERDGVIGMTQDYIRDGNLPLMNGSAARTKQWTGAFYKEGRVIRENDMLRLARLGGTLQQKMSAMDLIAEIAQDLRIRLDTRVEYCRWDALANNRIRISINGQNQDASAGIPADNFGVGIPIPWAANLTTAQVIKDLDEIEDKFFIKKGYRLKSAWFNSSVRKVILQTSDFKTRYSTSTLTPKEKISSKTLVRDWSMIFPGDEAYEYNAAYLSAADTLSTFIPDNKIVLIGEEAFPGEIMDWVDTPHIDPTDGRTPVPGMFAFVDDESKGKAVPKITVVAGRYGAVRARCPKKIVVVDITKTSSSYAV